jgi:hypothetical protein
MRLLAVTLAFLALIPSSASTELVDGSADKPANDLLTGADLKYQARNYPQAIETYKKIISRFPKSAACFTSHLRLGKHSFGEKQFKAAVSHLQPCAEGSGLADEQAESLYLIGISYYEQDQYHRALFTLRKVVAKFPRTDYWHKAYHTVGLALLLQKDYTSAIEAFRMVGTPTEVRESVKKLSPGGRLFIKVNDRDLASLSKHRKTLKVLAKTTSGDEEVVELHSTGITGRDFSGSIDTELGASNKRDEILQVFGSDKVIVEYIDTRAGNGKRHLLRTDEVTVASDAQVDAVDGIFKNRVQGVALDRNLNIRVVDYDRDLSEARDKVKVIVRSKREIREEAGRIVSEEDMLADRDESKRQFETIEEEVLELTERNIDPCAVTEPQKKSETNETPTSVHSGVFTAKIYVNSKQPKKRDGIIQAVGHGLVEIEYRDEVRLTGDKPVAQRASVVVVYGTLCGQIPFEFYKWESNELKVAESLLGMANIYKEMGIRDKADLKYAQTLKECARVDGMSGRFSVLDG